MDVDTIGNSSSCSSLSSYDADELVPTEIPTPEKFDEKIVDFLKCICCNKR
jgi:hypothetical protein